MWVDKYLLGAFLAIAYNIGLFARLCPSAAGEAQVEEDDYYEECSDENDIHDHNRDHAMM